MPETQLYVRNITFYTWKDMNDAKYEYANSSLPSWSETYKYNMNTMHILNWDYILFHCDNILYSHTQYVCSQVLSTDFFTVLWSTKAEVLSILPDPCSYLVTTFVKGAKQQIDGKCLKLQQRL